MYYVETKHGVVIDVCNNLPLALKTAQLGSSAFRVTPARVYSLVNSKKHYH